MNGKHGSSISRREFARRAAIASAVSMVPTGALPADSPSADSLPAQGPGAPALSRESQAEAEARYQAILAVYGPRFTDTQKTDLRRLCSLAQEPLDHLRAYTIENGDGPALYFKPPVEREKKPEAVVTPRTAGQAATKP
ncbi:MAG TPA: hypothetical protein VJW94_00970 [Candidatus Acidoferrum sp.]|nr:hypothetical protein [Candidatus Acidoferrum sp.]